MSAIKSYGDVRKLKSLTCIWGAYEQKNGWWMWSLFRSQSLK